jgi:hypothetical protein
MSTHYISNKCNGDGFGSQFQYLVSILLICYRNGYQFAYNKLTSMEHNYENDPDFMEKMENLMNLRPHFISFDDAVLQDAYITIYDMTAKYVIDNNINDYARDEYLDQIKTMFWANKNRNAVFPQIEGEPKTTHVAVHIRRLNSVDNRTTGTDTPDQFYLDAIQRVRNEHPDLKLMFHIYSQGSLDSFQCYVAEDTVLHIDESIETTFIGMVASDMLITSFSSLSYIAAFLSDGIIYYHPFWHPPRSTWICL